MSDSMSGSSRSKDGVMAVIIVNTRIAVRCRSGLSFRSLSSNSSGLGLESVMTQGGTDPAEDLQEGNDIGERRYGMHIGAFDDEPHQS